jgi:glucose/arabinose dehydrogenase/cytochrome c2
MKNKFSSVKWMAGASLLCMGGVTAVMGQNAPAGSVERGDKFFQASCAICHSPSLGAGNTLIIKQGPTLLGVVGRKAGTSPHFNYTQALKDSGFTWDAASLDHFLTDPAKAAPGTTMPIPLPDPTLRADVIAYLSTLKVPAGITLETAVFQVATNTGVDPNDWQRSTAGVRHRVNIADLPAPFDTPSAGNGPKVVATPTNAALTVPPGFTVKQFASGLTNPRLTRTAPNGDIFIAETGRNRIRVMRAADGADAPTENQIFAEGLERPFGISFYPPGDNPKWIYVANINNVVRFPYHTGDLKVSGEAEVIIPKLAGTTGGHTTRDVVFSQDGKRMFISVGSGSNVAEEMNKKTPEEIKAWETEHGLGAAWGPEENRANVLVTDPEGKAPLHPYATGIRNAVGLAINPTTGALWVSVNERDGLGDNLVPDYISSIKEGGYYGWPWYYLGKFEDPRHAGERPDLAGKAIVPDVLEQAHSASLEMTFYTATSGVAAFPAEYRGDAFVALHGSWNRATRTGYKIARARLKNGVATGEYEDFLTGFVVDAAGVWGRPVGVTVAHDGALLVTEDGHGTVWRISYNAGK